MDGLEKSFASILSRGWWLLLLRGIAAIVFGVLTWFLPGISLVALVLLFGAYSMVDGIFGVWTAIIGRKDHEDWWVMLLQGLLGVGVGILTFLVPGITVFALVFYIAIWAIAAGLLEIMMAMRLQKEIKGEWALVLAGLASVVFGILLMVQPAAGALTLLWLIASYAIVFGVLLLFLAVKARRFVQLLARS
ncbi:MAG TPA: HdeD family acid-resistance protein [Burkholderiales bacterium]|nr:HdeD family acid-resistance protein [Burkholderiales bacterium]